MGELPVTTPTDTLVPTQKPKHSKGFWVGLELVALLIWTFSLCKLFVFDVDTYLISTYLPQFGWVLTYKLLFVLGILAAWLWFIGAKLGAFLFVLLIFYPQFFVLWRVPYFIFRKKSWALAFATFNFVIESFRSFRRNVTVAAVISCCLAASAVSENKSVLATAAAGLLGTIVYLYVAALKSAFVPARIYSLYTRVLPPVRGYLVKNHKLDEAIRGLPSTEWSDAQRKIWVEKITVPILVNRSFLFLARRFRDYQRTALPYLHNVGIIVVLFLATVIAFAGINIALFKIDPSSYEVTKPGFFSFLWYGFNTFVFNFVKEVSPESVLAKGLWMGEAFLALFLIAIVVAMYLSIRSQRVSEQVEAIVQALEAEGQELESFVRNEYKIKSIDDAVMELDRLKAGLVQLMLWFTKNMR
jgi:hypothetical protein